MIPVTSKVCSCGFDLSEDHKCAWLMPSSKKIKKDALDRFKIRQGEEVVPFTREYIAEVAVPFPFYASMDELKEYVLLLVTFTEHNHNYVCVDPPNFKFKYLSTEGWKDDKDGKNSVLNFIFDEIDINFIYEADMKNFFPEINKLIRIINNKRERENAIFDLQGFLAPRLTAPKGMKWVFQNFRCSLSREPPAKEKAVAKENNQKREVVTPPPPEETFPKKDVPGATEPPKIKKSLGKEKLESTNNTVQEQRDSTEEEPEEKFQCSYCSRLLTSKGNLTKHYKTCKEKKSAEQKAQKEELEECRKQIKNLQEELNKTKEELFQMAMKYAERITGSK